MKAKSHRGTGNLLTVIAQTVNLFALRKTPSGLLVSLCSN